MPRTGWTPSIVPNGADQTAYLVVDNFGRSGTCYRETDIERTDLETVIVKMGIHRAVERLVEQRFNQSRQPYTNVTAMAKATSNKVVEE